MNIYILDYIYIYIHIYLKAWKLICNHRFHALFIGQFLPDDCCIKTA